MTLEALIFDVDGTLAETEEVHRAAFNRTFREHGLDWEWNCATYRELLQVAGGIERITHWLRTARPGALPAAELAQTVRALHKAKTANYVAALESGEVPLRPGVVRLLEEARAAGVRLAIATTTAAANIEELIGHSRDPVAMDWFEAVGAGNVVANKKPAPDIYAWMLARLGLPAAACVALEDSLNGLLSARAAGVPAVITTSRYTEGQDFSGALCVADSLGEPDAPAKFESGRIDGRDWIDLDGLRVWHAAAGG